MERMELLDVSSAVPGPTPKSESGVMAAGFGASFAGEAGFGATFDGVGGSSVMAGADDAAAGFGASFGAKSEPVDFGAAEPKSAPG